MSSLLICSMAWFLPAFIFPWISLFFQPPSTSLLSKEIDTVLSYLALWPFPDRERLDKLDSPGKQTTKPCSSLLWFIWIEPRNPFVWVGSSRKNGWPVCLRCPPSVHGLYSLQKREGQWGQVICVPARKPLATRLCICLSHVLGILATKGNLQR